MTTKFINWNDQNLLEEVIANSTSKKNVLEKFGYNPRSSISRRKLNEAILRFNISIVHFTNKKVDWKNIEAKLRELIANATTHVTVLRELGLKPKSGHYRTLKKYIKIYDIDISHFNPNTSPRNKIDLDEILQGLHPTYSTSRLKQRLYDVGLKQPICECCNLVEWHGKSISLELDHINGVSDDHRYYNLRILCPNCHSQTPTFKARNIGTVAEAD